MARKQPKKSPNGRRKPVPSQLQIVKPVGHHPDSYSIAQIEMAFMVAYALNLAELHLVASPEHA